VRATGVCWHSCVIAAQPPAPYHGGVRVFRLAASLLLVIRDMPTLRSMPSAPTRRPTITVIDTDQSWRLSEVGCHRTDLAVPVDVRAQELQGLSPVRTVINLAAPNALHTIAALRAGGYMRRFWGTIALNGSPLALPLGMVEAMPRPFKVGALFERLRGWVPQGAKIVAVSNRPEEFIPMRTALAREGFSVSLAWDATQAADLLGMMTADLVIVDLDMPHGAHAAVAALSSHGHVPNLVLVPGRGDDAVAFTATLRNPKIIAKLQKRHDVLEHFLHEGESAARHSTRIQGTIGAPSLQSFAMTA
jgi:CheY-like chemotaxis protein